MAETQREPVVVMDNNSGDAISDRPSSSSRNVIVFGLVVVAAIFLGLGAWSATAPLARAISATATLTVKGERKKVQHFEGGIVGSLHVTEGQTVQEGDLLVALDPLQANASVARHDGQLDQALARQARLESELRGESSIVLKGQFLERIQNDKKVFKVVEAEQKHLTARRETQDGRINILRQRTSQLGNEIEGLEIQRNARIEQLEIFKNELIGLRELHAKGFYPKAKLLAVERAIVDLRGAAGNDQALIARAKSAQGEAGNQIINVKQRFREEVVKELRDSQIEISDLNERLLVAKDIQKRVEIKAPRSGIVQGIQVHTIGGVVKPGDLLMEIAPQDDDLIVNAQVMPTDIDSLQIGQKAEVRLTALNTRTTPAIYGFVVSVSGDRLINSITNAPYFLSRIEIPLSEKAKLGTIKLTAGMPADVLIQTGERTALDYLIKPMTDAFARGLNEE
jgi:HlyD family secretion protein/epimerase transport system membrane fusion protein